MADPGRARPAGTTGGAGASGPTARIGTGSPRWTPRPRPPPLHIVRRRDKHDPREPRGEDPAHRRPDPHAPPLPPRAVQDEVPARPLELAGGTAGHPQDGGAVRPVPPHDGRLLPGPG